MRCGAMRVQKRDEMRRGPLFCFELGHLMGKWLLVHRLNGHGCWGMEFGVLGACGQRFEYGHEGRGSGMAASGGRREPVGRQGDGRSMLARANQRDGPMADSASVPVQANQHAEA